MDNHAPHWDLIGAYLFGLTCGIVLTVAAFAALAILR